MSNNTVTELVHDDLPMTDTIAICGLFCRGGGVSRVIEQQAIDLTEADYNVTVFAIESDMEAPEQVILRTINPVESHPILSKAYRLMLPFLPWMWYMILKLRSYDTIIAHRYPFNVAGLLASQTSDSVYVFWSHPSQYSPDMFSGIGRMWFQLIHYFETRSSIVASADCICAVSEDSKDYIKSHVQKPVNVVPNKVNECRFVDVTDFDTLRRRYEIDNSRVILFVGRITERKNIHSLVSVFNDISNVLTDTEFVIAGSESQSEYASHVKKKANSDITFTGYVPDADLAGLYRLADVFTTCSLEEGWGLPITEANHFNTPVVAFDSHPAANEVDVSITVPEGDYTAFRKEIINIVNNPDN